MIAENPTDSADDAPRRPRGRWLAPALLALGATVFLVRGPIRAMFRGDDFGWSYLGTRAWLNGMNPYRVGDLLAARGPGFPQHHDLEGIGSAYFPAMFPLALPFSLTDWIAAKTVYTIFLTALFGLVLWRYARLYLSDRPAPAALLFVALALLQYPPQTGLSLLQNSVPAVCLALLVPTFDLEKRRDMLLAAAIAAAAAACKPQIGAVAFLYGLVFWQWRFLFAVGAFYALLTAAGTAPLVVSQGGFGWIDALRGNIAAISAQQADIYCCLNLTPVMRHLLPVSAAGWIGLLAWLAVPALAWRFRGLRSGTAGPDARLAVISACGLVVMLSIYTRPYNATLLIPALVLLLRLTPLRWTSAGEAWRGAAAPAGLLLLGLAPFLQPVPPLGLELRLIGAAWLDWPPLLQAVWKLAVVPVQSYALLLLFVVVLRMAMRAPNRGPTPGG